jgi:hypothetical protein
MSWAIPRAIRLRQLAAARPLRLAAIAERKARRTYRPQDGTWNTSITFRGRRETLESVMGVDDIDPGEMIHRLWVVVKRHKLAEKTIAPVRLAGKTFPRPPTIPVDEIDDVQTYKRRRA